MDKVDCKNSCSSLVARLSGLIQTVQSSCLLELQKPQNEKNPIYGQFLKILINGVELVKKCEKTSRFNIFLNVRYASQIHKLEKDISVFLQYMPVNIFLEVKNMITELKSLLHHYKSGLVDESNINETIFQHVSKLTNDPQENAMMLQQMGADDMFDGIFVDSPCNYNELEKPDFVVGLEKTILNLKRILLHGEVSVIGVHSMGGVGKTTMALALCNDQEIKGECGFHLFKPFIS